MSKILGLDLGTNSIGWAVVETSDNKQFELLEKGVHIFQEGVKLEKGIEGSKASERTDYRSARRLKFRRKLRKYETLKVLSKYGMCPLPVEEVEKWRKSNFKKYPANQNFLNWLRTNEALDKNPYKFRDNASRKKIDGLELGRALYHIAQRRGFLSNRLETTKESDGAVKSGISNLSDKMKEGGYNTLGQYFYSIYKKDKIRGEYTGREEHYLQEFNTICTVQQLPDKIRVELNNAIFYQRPLKSQKGTIGRCPFETDKPRCAVSRPEFEEYRMLCFINNIKIKTPKDEKLRPLTEEEKMKITPLFFRKKEYFDFEDIAKKLAPKNQYNFYKSKDKNSEDYLFNYTMKTTVSGCPVSARFKSIFGENWKDLNIEYTREKDNKKSAIDINDVWHVLFTFDSNEKLSEFARKRLNLNDDQLKEFLKINFKQEYSSLSLKAIKKILPYLRQGLIYSHAVFLANMEAAIPTEIWNNDENKKIIREEVGKIIKTQNEDKRIIEIVNGMIKNHRNNNLYWKDEKEKQLYNDIQTNIELTFGKNRWNNFSSEKKERIFNHAVDLFKSQIQKKSGHGDFAKVETIDDRVKGFIRGFLGVYDKSLDKLYHPSAIDVYKPPIKKDDGKLYLGSPMVSSIRNPMAMRALHQLRRLINELIKQDIIDPTTKINIEMSRDLKNANERKALQSWQRDRENLRKEYAERIKEYYEVMGINKSPSKDDILKYQLWEEQEHICIYTGKTIGIADFLGKDPKFDIEHTIPRSLSFDNSQANKTLCQNKFNRDVKRNKIPFELATHDEILARMENWKEKYEELNKQIQVQVKRSKSALTKDAKDNAIQRRHKLTAERNYWKNKYDRFTMKDVPTGFKNSQIVDTGIITKYSLLYLKKLFNKVYTVKGSTVADFRKIWGLQQEYEKKSRVNHTHHCIDAITIACISKEHYEELAKYYHDYKEMFLAGIDKKPNADKPWPTFTQDVKEIEKEVFVSHYTPDNLPKQSKKKLRKRGKIQRNSNGETIYQQGDTVRGKLHKDTFYGAIKREITNKKGKKEEKVLYVVRKPVDTLSANDIKHIVDNVVREKVQKAVDEKGLKQALNEPIWMNEDKLIPIRKVRCYTPMVTNPIHLKNHRDISKNDYKQSYHVSNDGNYLMAIYEGKTAKGKIKRDFKIVNKLEAGEYFKFSNQKKLQHSEYLQSLVPKLKKAGKIEMPLKAILKIGTQVILWENKPDEIWDLEKEEIRKRLYKVVGLSMQVIQNKYHFATIVMRFHQEASQASELKVQDGAFFNNEQYKAQRKLNHNQFNALVEGYDFQINILGQIKKIKNQR